MSVDTQSQRLQARRIAGGWMVFDTYEGAFVGAHWWPEDQREIAENCAQFTDQFFRKTSRASVAPGGDVDEWRERQHELANIPSDPY